MRGIAALVGVTVMVVGCAKPSEDYVKLGEKAPALGSAGKKSMAEFLPGKWTLSFGSSDPLAAQMAKLMGTNSIEEFWSFEADGSFTDHINKDLSLGGRWAPEGNLIRLTYTTYGGKDIEKAKAEAKAAEEKGTQGGIKMAYQLESILGMAEKKTLLGVDSTGKRLAFYMPSLDGSLRASSLGLDRMGKPGAEK